MSTRKTQNNKWVYSFTAQDLTLTIFLRYQSIENLTPLQASNTIQHTHEYYELFYNGQNSAMFEIDGVTHHLNKNDFLIINPRVKHISNPTGNPSQTLFGCEFSLEPNFVSSKYNDSPIISYIMNSPYVIFAGDAGCLALKDCLKEAMQTQNVPAAAAYLYILLMRAADLYKQDNDNTNTLLTDNNALRLFQIDSIFARYFTTDISLSMIAAHLHLSERQLSRIIQKQYGCSFRQVLLKKRMAYAKDLLKNGIPIPKVAETIGYTSTKSFCTAFHKYTGVNPGKYRSHS